MKSEEILQRLARMLLGEVLQVTAQELDELLAVDTLGVVRSKKFDPNSLVCWECWIERSDANRMRALSEVPLDPSPAHSEPSSPPGA